MAVMATAALILSLFANSRCNLLKISTGDFFDFWTGGYTPVAFGAWCIEVENGDYYSLQGESVDSKFQAARALGTTASSLGFCVWIYYLFSFVCANPVFYMIAAFCSFCVTLFQGLVFLFFKSEVCVALACSLDTGGKCAISATVLWFITCLMTCAAAKTAGHDEDGGEEEVQPKEDKEVQPNDQEEE